MKKNVLFLACLSAFLISCDSASVIGTQATVDSGSNDTTPETTPDIATDTVNSVGLVRLESLGVTADSTRGLFGELPEPRTEQAIRDWYIPPEDTCTVINLTTAPPQAEFQVFDQAATLVSAGESVILSDDNGTYATLVSTAGQTGPLYLPEIEIDQPAGPNLTVDIPGEQFSAFAGIPVPPVPELQLVSPGLDENVGVSTFFQWIPNNVPGSVVEVFTTGISSMSNEPISIRCNLVDDGNFSFPAAVQAEMGAFYNDDFTTLTRVSYNVVGEDDTLVFIANSVNAQSQ